MNQDISYGYCHCGCGQKTTIPKYTDRSNGGIKDTPRKFLPGHNVKNQPVGSSSRKWKGGKVIINGYDYIYMPEHPRSNSSEVYVKESFIIAENALGKPLPKKVVVHHHNTKQLVICENQSYHMLIHRRQRALKACGHANWRKCRFCKEYDDPCNLIIHPNYVHHRKCINLYNSNLRNK